MTRPIDSLLKKLGYEFTCPELLTKALTHSSATRIRTHSNQRLEFLGDRVLGLVMAQFLFARFEHEEEGELSRRHAALVRREALTRVAVSTGLSDHMNMSKSEEHAGGRDNPNILADCCEALIAAIYLDGGLTAAETFIVQYWSPMVDEDLNPPKDPKTSLQEWAQGRGLALPVYSQTKREGKDHAPVFHVEVALDGFDPVSGAGPSKRTAEQEAAQGMLSIVHEKS